MCHAIHIVSIRRKRQKSSTPGIERPSVGIVFAEPPAAVLDTSEHPHHSHERAVYFCLFVRRKCYGFPVGPVSTYYRPRGLSDLHAGPSRRCESPLSRTRCQDVAQLKAALDFSSQPMPSVARTVELQHIFVIGRLQSTSQRSRNRDITKYFFFIKRSCHTFRSLRWYGFFVSTCSERSLVQPARFFSLLPVSLQSSKC